ncbi:hypothetical protein Q3G72_023416 [Acer saccharum]|nr:hypothetical protein Q3G72_023416 [Acer saccharum]
MFIKRVKQVDMITDTTHLTPTQTRNNRVRVMLTHRVLTQIATPILSNGNTLLKANITVHVVKKVETKEKEKVDKKKEKVEKIKAASI